MHLLLALVAAGEDEHSSPVETGQTDSADGNTGCCGDLLGGGLASRGTRVECIVVAALIT